MRATLALLKRSVWKGMHSTMRNAAQRTCSCGDTFNMWMRSHTTLYRT